MISMENIMNNEDRHEARTYQKLPVVVSRANGTVVWDVNGKDYIDLSGGYGVAILGHNNRMIRDAISEQLERVSIVHNSLYNDIRSSFLEHLSHVVPQGLGTFYLGNSGTEAVEAAIKTAVKYTGKKQIVSMHNSYHGKTLGSLSITHSEKYRKSFGELVYKGVHFVKYGDANSVRDLPEIKDVAAIFVEPVQGEGGIIIPDKGYLKELREIADDNDTLLVFDEIQSGLGRTGKMWAHQYSGVKPDLMTIGKGIGGGIPFGITSGSEEVMGALSLGEMSSTLGGNPLACAAGSAVLRQINEALLDEIVKKGEYMRVKLQESFEESRIVKGIRGIGMMHAIDLRVRFVPVLMEMIRNGILALYSGVSTIRMLPPYTISYEDIDLGTERIAQAITSFGKASGVIS